MTTIRTTCVACGDIELTVDQVRVEAKHYSFDCPQCGCTGRRLADRRVATMLLTVGAQHAAVGPITEEEIARFVMELDLA